ncbi:hypothetical protein J1605_010115 [Eschrichtius robustus]|uniref:Uncharacterized protein n=1 Tax=Eschrichtius robustus TaxID=9764 RepID=A0AB34GTW0_ESCRO|nr:hypothetical protein J1605_010115 [Eschrichtius robustus]
MPRGIGLGGAARFYSRPRTRLRGRSSEAESRRATEPVLPGCAAGELGPRRCAAVRRRRCRERARPGAGEARTMSGGEVVCSGWLRKSPPEKKLKRYAGDPGWTLTPGPPLGRAPFFLRIPDIGP